MICFPLLRDVHVLAESQRRTEQATACDAITKLRGINYPAGDAGVWRFA